MKQTSIQSNSYHTVYFIIVPGLRRFALYCIYFSTETCLKLNGIGHQKYGFESDYLMRVTIREAEKSNPMRFKWILEHAKMQLKGAKMLCYLVDKRD